MAEAEEKKIRKNRTFYSRVEEIEEMYGREPTGKSSSSLVHCSNG
jgi:hypothetical protein